MSINRQSIAQLNQEFYQLDLNKALSNLRTHFKHKITFSSSLGLEDQVITDAIFRRDLDIEIFSLDTGRLFPETLSLLDETQRKYNKSIKVYYPQNTMLEHYVSKKGINALYDTQHDRKECCYIRKIEPLNRALHGAQVWVSGIRQAQSDYRSEMQFFEWDAERELVKFNPLLKWSTNELWQYVHQYEVPYNRLHEQGFPSIGCAPCTRAIAAGEDERAGRWWWEQADKKECGLHTHTELPAIVVA